MPAISLRELDEHLEADKPFSFPYESYDMDVDTDYLEYIHGEDPVDHGWLFDDGFDYEDYDPYPMFEDFYD